MLQKTNAGICENKRIQFPEKPQHLGLKIEPILRKRLDKVN